ncbi:MAG: Z-ring formation inhibitor MciZ [Candidatus Aminicenantes bacterium]|nr:Z-ring formation inhibitor MciZ [Candidatus Aminicenantes bacterium]NIM78087.1 Z-ring formation inhibitor MciZ [Candidatus Aminicenantes bacterium]NIN17405.1 Z-ring formation inhibitor MciZ [Candidatus Aminicenantes bacterium]NIN41301.1 Z-ring formation inhibitor MciZ [Candidatus Aminicenantes bacterium]NIN84071.1 Z-ring formation inhibitor MciZ [Candidatus Aminicenantes bacterium]
MKSKFKNLSILTVSVFLVVLFLGGHAYTQSFKLPTYEKFTLENGLTVYLMEHHEVPLIYVSVVFPAGAVKDNGKYGLASLTADGLLFGTKNYTKKQIEEELDYLGASYSTYAEQETASVFMSFLNTDQDNVFPILKEIIMYPVFDQKEFEKRKKRLLMQLEQAKERPATVMSSYSRKFLYGDHVYGNPTSGTRSSVKKISLDDLKAFYKTNYKPDASAIAVVGDFKTSKMKAAIKKLFRNWRFKGKSPEIQQKPPAAFKKSRLLLVNKEDATETRFMIGTWGIKRSNPDYVAIQVVNTILGGRFTSWLNDELRVNAGLTYGAFSYFSTFKTSGTFFISSFTQTAKTVKAIDLALEVLDRLHTKGIDQKTLSSAKNYIKGQYPPIYETAGSLANLLTSMFTYGFDESFINDFQENVDSMTVEKTKEIIKKYFPKDNLQFVLIGKASEIRDKVKKYGEIIEKEIKAVGF